MGAGWGRAETYRLLNLFGDVFERVRAEYVEPINDREAVENAINGMLTGLDPHSSYLNQRSYRDMQVQTRGEFGGLGIEVTQESGYIKVISPIDETPASRAGVKAGDLITHLNGNRCRASRCRKRWSRCAESAAPPSGSPSGGKAPTGRSSCP
ncbi:S41 family peptidase [Siccirubricoccus deserti]